VFEIGGPDVLRYIEMIERVGRARRKTIPSVPVPLLSPACRRGGSNSSRTSTCGPPAI
jgi:hypothetical protein